MQHRYTKGKQTNKKKVNSGTPFFRASEWFNPGLDKVFLNPPREN